MVGSVAYTFHLTFYIVLKSFVDTNKTSTISRCIINSFYEYCILMYNIYIQHFPAINEITIQYKHYLGICNALLFFGRGSANNVLEYSMFIEMVLMNVE